MFDPDGPLANRGPEALQRLLVSGAAEAHEQVRLLTLSELSALAEAADQLADLARMYVRKTCEVCGAPIAWNPNEPTGQAAGWRHVDMPALYRGVSHRAAPAAGPMADVPLYVARATAEFPHRCSGCGNHYRKPESAADCDADHRAHAARVTRATGSNPSGGAS